MVHLIRPELGAKMIVLLLNLNFMDHSHKFPTLSPALDISIVIFFLVKCQHNYVYTTRTADKNRSETSY
jgi:hypothetical protein